MSRRPFCLCENIEVVGSAVLEHDVLREVSPEITQVFRKELAAGSRELVEHFLLIEKMSLNSRIRL